MRILLVAGTRPEIIKLQPVYDALIAQGDKADWAIVNQSPDLLAEHCPVSTRTFLVSLTPPHPRSDREKLVDLHTEIMFALKHRLDLSVYDVIVVQGDTQTACAGALTAALMGIPVAHVEAGLRTHKTNPWPEEMNRKLIAQVASLHFAPTEINAFNLRNENIPGDRILIVGQTGIDALYASLAHTMNHASPTDREEHAKPRIVVTCHRRENKARISLLASALRPMLETHVVTWPTHPNYGQEVCVNFPFVSPMSHDDLVSQLQVADLVITDSGGIIEEAAELEKPCLIIRDETERPEALDPFCQLVPFKDMAKLRPLISFMLDRSAPGERCSQDVFGTRGAGARIATALRDFVAEKS